MTAPNLDIQRTAYLFSFGFTVMQPQSADRGEALRGMDNGPHDRSRISTANAIATREACALRRWRQDRVAAI